MNNNPVRPRWRLLDVILILTFGLLAIEAKAHLSSLGHQFAEVTILLVWLLLMWAWLRANASAISQEQWQKSGRTYRIVPGRISVYRNSALPGHRTSGFTASASGPSRSNQASAAPEYDSLHPLGSSSAGSVTGIVASEPGAHETASGGPTGTGI